MKGRFENITGNLQIKNGKYYVLVNLYDLSGKRTIKWVALGLDTKCGKKLARARMAEILEEYNSSQRRLMKAASKKKDPDRFITEWEKVQQMPVTEFLREWIRLSENRLQPTTIDGYNKMIDGRITDYFGDNGTTVGDLAGEDLNEFYACLQRSGLSATSALRFHGLFHAAMKYAVKKEFLDDNPCDHADRPKQERYRASFYSEGEVRALLEAAKSETLYIPLMLAAYYGLRRSEALGVKWSNIDFTAKTVSISHKVIEARENGRFKPKGFDKMKNKSSNRTLPLIPEVEKELIELRIRQQANAKILGTAYNHEYDDYVCTDETGMLITPNYISRTFGNLLKKHGLRHIRYHDLRHTCASLLLKNGIPMKAIQEWLGHATFEVTANTYAHLDYSSQEQSARQIAALLG